MRFALLILLACAQLASAATYYFREDGSDANVGTADTAGGAWLTLQKVFNTVAAGDTVYGTGTFTNDASTVTSGTGASPIRILGGATTNTLIYTGRITTDHSNYEYGFWTFKDNRPFFADGPQSTNITIHHSYFTNTTPQSVNLTRDNATTNGPKAWKFVFNRVDNWAGGTTLTLVGERHVIQSNRFERCEQTWDVFAIYGDNHVIADNYIANLISGTLATPPNGRHGDIFQFFDGASSPFEYMSRSNVFERNYVTNSSYQWGNATANNGSTNMGPWTFRNNVFVNSRSQVNGEIPWMRFYQNTIFNNTNVYGLRFSDSVGGGGADSGRVMNNLFVRIGTYAYASNTVTDFLADGNWFSSSSDGGFSTAVLDGPFGNTNGFNPSDVFVDWAAGDFRIKAGAPILNKGTNTLDVVSTDYLGNSLDASPEPGAFQYVPSGSTINAGGGFFRPR